MKNETNQPKSTRLKGFYTALLISLAMIGAACAYAYQATTKNLEENLNSLQNDLTAETKGPSMEMKPVTEPPTEPESHEAYEAAADVKKQVPSETSEAAEEETTAEETEIAEETFDHVLVMPLEGEIQAEFSDGELVKSVTTGTWQTHNGADIAAEEGTAVRAADNGTVSEVSKDPLWGICVTIDHRKKIKNAVTTVVYILLAILIWNQLWRCDREKIKFRFPLLFVIYMNGIYWATYTPEIYSRSDVSGGVPNTYFHIFLLITFANMIYVHGWVQDQLVKYWKKSLFG